MFNNSNGGYSLADIAAATGNSNNGVFGGNQGWWIIVLFLFIFCGWGGRGYGGWGGSTASGADPNYVLTTDFATLERKMDGINNGLCDGFYTQAQLTNGVNSNISTASQNVLNAIQANSIAAMQDTNALQAQISQCC